MAPSEAAELARTGFTDNLIPAPGH
jgi:hypothetical protein